MVVGECERDYSSAWGRRRLLRHFAVDLPDPNQLKVACYGFAKNPTTNPFYYVE